MGTRSCGGRTLGRHSGPATLHCPVLGLRSWSQQTGYNSHKEALRDKKWPCHHQTCSSGCPVHEHPQGVPRFCFIETAVLERTGCVDGIIPEWGGPPRSTVAHRRVESKTPVLHCTAAAAASRPAGEGGAERSVWRRHGGWRGQPTKGSTSRTYIPLCQRP